MSLLKKGVRLYVFASLLRPGVYASTTSEAEIFDGVALTHSKLSLSKKNAILRVIKQNCYHV